MREIKFKAWDNKNKVMYPTAIIDATGNVVGIFEDQKSLFEVGRVNIMQYTGLKDKNGEEIYEGDYLGDQWGNKHVVVWDNKQAKFMFVAGCEYATIIGNIYENPELLK